MKLLNKKLLFGFVILSFLLLVPFAFGQSASQNKLTIEQFHGKKVPASLLKKTVIKIDNESAEKVLITMAEKNNLNLSYNKSNLQLNKKVTLNLIDVYVLEGLLAVAQEIGARLEITRNGNLTILPNEVAVEEESLKNGQISGYVQDIKTGDVLPGANVWLDGTSLGSATNDKGEFIILNVPPGNYNIRANYIGYGDYKDTVTVKSGGKTFKIIDLKYSGAGESETIVVQAQASGQMQAINQQLSATEIKNVVSKDKIRQLPQANAAEAVGRLPGISLARSGGEGYGVIIRGLSPKYSKIMVDGVSLAPTGSNDRAVSMGSISSYSLEGIEVIKSPTANMDGDQVGGSVNLIMRTAKPGLKAEIIAEGGYRGLRNEVSGYNFVANISNRFLNDKLGVFVQIITDGKDMGSNNMGAGYKQKSQIDSIVNPLRIVSTRLKNNYTYRKRYDGSLTFDYRLTEGKVFFKNFLSSSHSESQVYNEYFGTSVHQFNASDYSFDRLMMSNVLGYEQYFSNIKISSKFAHTYSGGEMPEDIAFYFSYGSDMYPYEDNTAPEEIPGYAKNQFDKFIWNDAYVTSYRNDGRQLMGKVDLETNFNIFKQLTGKVLFGGKFRYDDHSYDRESYRSGIQYGSAIFANALIKRIDEFNHLPLGTTSFPYDLFIDKNSPSGEIIDGQFNMGPYANIDLLNRIIDVLQDVEKDNPGVDGYRKLELNSQINDYSGTERYAAGYLMAEFNITKNLLFTPGIRYEHKNTKYHGVHGYSGGLATYDFNGKDTTSVRNNEFWLPMIHLKYQPLDWLQVRLAYTKTLARPNYTSIIPNMSYNNESISMHNPYLRPELAESYDLYFAFSENHLGLFTIGGFWKNIEDKIFTRGDRLMTDPEKYNLPETFKGLKFSTQENNETISVSKGIEIDWQTNFWYLPSVFKGFVFNINYTKIFSNTTYPKFRIERMGTPWAPIDTVIDESYEDRLTGQPDHILNVALGYDYKGFSARLSMNYQSDIFSSASFWQEYRSFSDALTLWDFQIRQKLPWAGLLVYCNASNITGAVERTHFYEGKPRTANYYGESVNVGLIWRINNDD